HLIIGFVSIESNSIQVNAINDHFIQHCKSVINLHKSDTQLMISIGGGNNDNGFHSTALTPGNRKQLANSAINTLLKYGLDGLDIDWEFPGWATVHYNDKNTFNLLLKEVKQTFREYSVRSHTKELVLSVAVAAQYTIIKRSYSAPQLNEYVDFINLMAYDYYLFHRYWPFVGHNSPLSSRSSRIPLFTTFSTQWSANNWHQLGVHKSKIMVGIPTYGRSFRLAFGSFTSPGSLATSSSQDMSYSQVCQFLDTKGTTVAFDEESGVPYAFRDNTWITYESTESALKKSTWIRDNGFGGVMTFSLNADDLTGQCHHNHSFPIHHSINSVAKQ
ncbi:unnamed protein product, partial [Oppiella nova]